MRVVMIEYTLKPDLDVGDIEPSVQRFVAGLKEHGGDTVRYTSFRKEGDAPRFAHLGIFRDVDRLANTQEQPFFGEFARFLKERCVEGPTVTNLSVVASTEKNV